MRGDGGGAELLGDQEAVLLVAHDNGGREAGGVDGTKSGLLQEGTVRRDERPELLREGLARDRPEAGAGAAGEDDGNDLLRGHGGEFA